MIKDQLFDVPPLFKVIQQQSGTDWKEMYKVFNMGHRLEIYVPEPIASDIIDVARHFEIDAQVIGRVEKAPRRKVTVKSEFGEFTYE